MNFPTLNKPEAIFFDLDGTLLDTAPDLSDAANILRLQSGLIPLSDAELRPFASAGARGLIGRALNKCPDDPEFQELRRIFLDYYSSHLSVRTSFFSGVEKTLETLDKYSIKWGIVTNKPHIYTIPVLKAFNLFNRACAIVSGDSTSYSKPHPEPLFHAARITKVSPQKCWYVGDDLRDIQAGKSAEMLTIAAAYGYCGENPIETWNADHIIQSPIELINFLD